MVLSMLVAIITCPAMLATAEAIRQGQSKERREEHRARRCNLVVTCVKASTRSAELDNRLVLLRDGKLYIDTMRPTSRKGSVESNDDYDEKQDQDIESRSHAFAGYYLPYPDTKFEGLVSTISDKTLNLNWIYVDKDTYQVKYGLRVDAQPNITGPFDCTRQDRRMTLEGWEGFVAVEESPGVWALYFDRDDNGLESKVARGTRVLEVELWRREKRWTKDPLQREQEQATQNTRK